MVQHHPAYDLLETLGRPHPATIRGYHKTIMGRILFPPHTPSPRFYIMSVRCYYGITIRFNYRMPPQTLTLFTGAQSFCSLWLICHGAAELQITGGRPQSVNRVDYVCKNKRVMRLVGFLSYSILTSIHIYSGEAVFKCLFMTMS